MSTTLSTSAMVALLQKRVPIGISAADALGYLNEAFRKLNQMSKGGFVWNVRGPTAVNVAMGAVTFDMPADFDPGKSAWLFGNTPFSPTATEIAYKPWSEFVNYEHMQVTGANQFAVWTYVPNFTLTPAPTSYLWTGRLKPTTAAPGVGGLALQLIYHVLNIPAFASGANIYFPTPDQFDSMIVDLAEAEVSRQYSISGWEKLVGQANQAIAEVIDTYRTDRYDLSGMVDQALQAQEKQAERDR